MTMCGVTDDPVVPMMAAVRRRQIFLFFCLGHAHSLLPLLGKSAKDPELAALSQQDPGERHDLSRESRK